MKRAHSSNRAQKERVPKSNNNSSATKAMTLQHAEPEQTAVAAENSKESETTRRKAETGLSSQPEPIADQEVLAREVEKRGNISLHIAKKCLGHVSDRGSVGEILAVFEAGSWKNPPGALRAMFRNPEEFGLERTSTGTYRRKESQNGGRHLGSLARISAKAGKYANVATGVASSELAGDRGQAQPDSTDVRTAQDLAALDRLHNGNQAPGSAEKAERAERQRSRRSSA
jgi:hypothetical protein